MSLSKACSLALLTALFGCASIPKDDVQKEVSVSWNRVDNPTSECQKISGNTLTFGKQVACFVPPVAGRVCAVYSREDAPEELLGEALRGCLGESTGSTSWFSFGGKAAKAYLKEANVKTATIRWKQTEGFRKACARSIPQWAVPQIPGEEEPVVWQPLWAVPQSPANMKVTSWGCAERYPRGEVVSCNVFTPHKIDNLVLGEEFIHCFGYGHRD